MGNAMEEVLAPDGSIRRTLSYADGTKGEETPLPRRDD